MKNMKEYIVKIQTEIEITKMYKQIEKEESKREEQASFEVLHHYFKVAEHAIAETKKADTYEEALYWLGMAKRYSIRVHKMKQQLEKIES